MLWHFLGTKPHVSSPIAAAVVTSDRKILSEVVTRQDEVHAPIGGIVPKTAAQCHAQNIDKTVDEAMSLARVLGVLHDDSYPRPLSPPE